MYPIASYVVPAGGSGGVTFSNIPQTFQHLHVRIWAKGVGNYSGSGLSSYLNCNGTANAGYRHYYHVFGSNISAGNFANSYGTVAIYPDSTYAANLYGTELIDIFDYTATGRFKTAKYWGGYATNGTGTPRLTWGSWCYDTTAAINYLYISGDGTYAAGTRFDLYGIASTQNVSLL